MKQFLLPVAVIGLAAASGAQSLSITVPNYHASTDSERQSTFPFGYTAGRTQQIISGDQIAKNTGLIQEFAYRQDAWLSPKEPGRQISRVIVTMGTTSVQPGKMFHVFASNRSTTMTRVFDGRLSLPAPGNGSPRPFDIRFKLSAPYVFLPAQGNLLLELEIPGKPTRTAYVVDAAVAIAGGASTTFGIPGAFAMGDKHSFTNLDSTKLRPGGEIEVSANGLKNPYAALAAFGFSKTRYGNLTLPLDLGVLGAPKNYLYTSTELVLPIKLRPMYVGWAGSTQVPIPQNPELRGLQLFSQGIYLDTKANRFGLVFSSRVDMTLGSGKRWTQQIVNEDATSAKGYEIVGEFGNVIQFKGVFQ